MFGRRKIEIKTDAQLHTMARAGLVTSRALDAAVSAAVPGTSTAAVDRAFRRVLDDYGAESNFLGYFGYPATVCTSPNEIVVHGIPREDVLLAEGDLLSIDGGAIIEGWHGDSARTVEIGEVRSEDRELSELTRAALWRGIAAAATAERVGEIGVAIERFIRQETGERYGIIEDFVGHGIGSQMHMAPDVLNYAARDLGPKLRAGMALAIEPMLVTGSVETETLEDGWTVRTVDGGRASQWEHSVAFHREGIWVLTAEDGGAEELAPWGVVPAPIPE